MNGIRVYDPYCPEGVIYTISSGSITLNLVNGAWWEETMWNDVWGTGLRPIRFEYL